MRAIISCILLAATVGLPALAEDLGPFNKWCYENDSPDQKIQACSAVIGARVVDRTDLATAFRNRANAYQDKGHLELAIEDYDRSIELNPLAANSFNGRGTAHRAKGQFDLAIRDYDQAIGLSPDNAMVLSNRCFAKAVYGQLE